MDVLVPAFLLAVLTLAGDRITLLVARLGEERPVSVAIAAGLGHAVPCLVAGAAAVAMTPHMPLRAQSLFLAAALVVSGLALLWPAGTLPKLADGRFGAIATALLAGAVLGAGAAPPLFVLALGIGGSPWLAATGGAIGALALFGVAALSGRALWEGLPRAWIRVGVAALLLLAGLTTGLSAAGLA